MNACETSLRSHNHELAAQRLMIQQLTEAVQRLNGEKETNIDKLNDLVTLVDHRFAESQAGIQEIREVTHKRFETLSGTMTNIANEIVQKLIVINQDIELLKRSYQAPPAPSSTPQAPPSWTETPSTPTRPPAAETSSNTRPSEPAPNFGHSSNQDSNSFPTAGKPATYGPSRDFGSTPTGSAPRDAQPEPPTGPAREFGPRVSHFHMGSPGSPLTGAGVQWAPRSRHRTSAI